MTHLHPLSFVDCPAIGANADDWRRYWCGLEEVLRQSMTVLLERNGGPAAGWIDTKLDITTSRPADPADPLRGRGVIYGWVQGRALESFARHAGWWHHCRSDPRASALADRLRAVVAHSVEHLETVRAKRGRLSFMMDRQGCPLDMDQGRPVPGKHEDSPHSLTDLFYAKGLAEAGHLLKRDNLLSRAESMLRGIIVDILAGRLWLDQVALDPRNRVGEIPGRHSQAPSMLGIAAASRVGVLTGHSDLIETAGLLATGLLARHAATEACGTLRAGDFWEFVDDNGEPYIDDGVLHSDPGHAIEAAGFYFNLVALRGGHDSVGLTGASDWARVLLQNFENGWKRYGVVKTYDLLNRRVIYNQLPWWPLPETMRASIVALPYVDACMRPELMAIFNRASRALTRHFLNPAIGMAVPCLGPDGRPVGTIPAVPDADPGYHTNLCLIDVLTTVQRHGWETGLPY